MKENIINLAREAGFDTSKPGKAIVRHSNGSWIGVTDELEHFAQLVASASAAKEREACEALYEHEDVQAPVGNSAWGEAYQDGWIAGAQAYREAIRARGQQ